MIQYSTPFAILLGFVVVPLVVYALCRWLLPKRYGHRAGAIGSCAVIGLFAYGLTFGFEEFKVTHIEYASPEVPEAFNAPVMTDKIVVNHYHTKSREEYLLKRGRGRADILGNDYDDAKFNAHDRNEIFDDGILKYCASRTENFPREGDEQRPARVFYTLKKNLSGAKISLETALTCRGLSTYLREKFPDDDIWKFYEQSSLSAVSASLSNLNVVEVQLFLRELPNLLTLPYAVVRDLSNVVTLKIVPQIMNAGNK